MITADGRIWENPAVGYHLRDNGMKLDHVSYMTKIFLGTDIACAQMPRRPIPRLDPVRILQLSAFLAGLDTKGKPQAQPANDEEKPQVGESGSPWDKLYSYFMERDNIDLSNEKQKQKLRGLVNRSNRSYNEMLNATVGRPQQKSAPQTPRRLPVRRRQTPPSHQAPVHFIEEEPAKVAKASDRQRLAQWLVSDKNTRFADSIANRMWHRFFGRGVAEPLHNYLEEDAYNPELLQALVQLCATSTSTSGTSHGSSSAQRLITPWPPAHSSPKPTPTILQAPVPRRMTAEQAWDSLLTLMLETPLQWKAGKGEKYNEIINLKAAGTSKDIAAVLKRINQYRAYRHTHNLFSPNGHAYAAAAKQPAKKGNGANGEMMMDASMSMMMKSAGRNRLVLARASELGTTRPRQPFPPQIWPI